MNRVLSVSFVLISIIVWSEANRPYVGDKLIRLEPQNEEQVQYLRDLEENNSLDFWTDAVGAKKSVELHLQKDEFDQYIAEFKARSIPYSVLVNDLQTVIDDEKRTLEEDLTERRFQSRIFGRNRENITGTYARFDAMVTFMQQAAADNPSYVRVVDLNTTYEGRMIKGVVLSFNPSAQRNIWIDCGIHARGIK